MSKSKPVRLLLVDSENIPHLERVDATNYTKIFVFVGPQQTSVRLPEFGDLSNLSLIRIAVGGRNSLDMHLAMHLGQLVQQHQSERNVMFEILSKDTDFDPLVKHVKALGHPCQRVTLEEDKALVITCSTSTPKQHRILPESERKFFDTLLNSPCRPSTKEALVKHTHAHRKRLNISSKADARKIVSRWESAGLIRFSNNKKQSAKYEPPARGL